MCFGRGWWWWWSEIWKFFRWHLVVVRVDFYVQYTVLSNSCVDGKKHIVVVGNGGAGGPSSGNGSNTIPPLHIDG
jgi:hypothetical protein